MLKLHFRSVLFVSVSALMLLAAPNAYALVTGGGSSGYDAFVDLQGGGGGVVTGGPVNSLSNTAPPTYSQSNTVLDVTVPASPDTVVAADATTITISSNIDGLSASGQAQGEAWLERASGNLETIIPNLFQLTADSIKSNALASGVFGGLSAVGSTEIINGVLTVGGGAPITLDSNPAPNTVLYSGGGLTITLNQQIVGGDGSAAADILVNAIHIDFNNVAATVGSLVTPLNGDIIMGQSTASISAVPEPGTALLMLLGLGSLSASGRRQR